MSAKLRDLEETLPAIPADPPRPPCNLPKGRAAATLSARQEEVENIVIAAGKRLTRNAERQSQSVTGFAAASLYRLVGSRVDMAKYAKNPELEIMALQKTLSLLTWELGNTLEDIRLSEPTKQKDNK